ncbi:AAA family ATPase [Halomonas sp. LR5S13]|uniref:AAA family ATPase n=1 Tax=Halomonas rhizosphaerae TaxID=3043296 RepID=UPI0024A96D12|nr:AAA family ATPase [Halomonas rhizosphaerae]MDI5922709.1 AAA family ATPase [Halomonas rhizosphaerae]
MKLISASIKNFRLLKDLRLDFSIDPEKPLTVIRAANETGKTTCLNALMWCLYGSSSLPSKGRYSLFPTDEVTKGKERIEVSVEIDFEAEHAIGKGRGRHEYVVARYKLKRSCIEFSPSDKRSERENELYSMWEVSDEGLKRIEQAMAVKIIEDALPETLKDVYFTDGDRAMSFIEAAASSSVKRQRVTSAIESLLGINTLKRTISHLDNVTNKFSQEIDNRDYAKELENLNDRIESYKEDIESWTSEREDAEEKIEELNKELKSINTKLDESLMLGDKDKLVKKKDQAIKNIERMTKSLETSQASLARLTCSEVTSTAMLADFIDDAKERLTGLNKNKQLPKVNVPILEELLDRDVCFCGSDLRTSVVEGEKRRSEIIKAIESSRQSDKVQEAASSLFYRVRSLNTDDAEAKWVEKYSDVYGSMQNIAASIKRSEEDLKEVEKDIKGINDSHIEKLKEQREHTISELQKFRGVESSRSSQIEEVHNRLKDADHEREVVRKRLGKTNTSAVKWDLGKACKDTFSLIIDKLLKEELAKVSHEMNRIFLSMIGAGAGSTDLSLITRAELTEEFDIAVYGHSGVRLNPDQDLNGASRRAITLSFILALTKVSEAHAPNIIDTPLGMMAGYVKQSVLYNTVKEGSQVILFLTHDEIQGVESIIDKYAGVFYTLTNPGHYPKMLKNPPPTDESKVMRCECNYYQHCDLCERVSLEVA